ncbi:MAG: hypothetical protein CR997_07890 [Acidobacteria bacterium]|nr:MAG: hypothetical protein CR997_07890 [Acidobacteriota bacterium]
MIFQLKKKRTKKRLRVQKKQSLKLLKLSLFPQSQKKKRIRFKKVNELRLSPRIDCDETTVVIYQSMRVEVKIVDASYGGIGIQVENARWEPFEDALEVKGEIELDNGTACYDARVCWTSSSSEYTKAGLEIKHIAQDSWRQWVDNLKGIEPPDIPMFDVG